VCCNHTVSEKGNIITIHLLQDRFCARGQHSDDVIALPKEPGEKNNIFRKFTDTCNYDRLNMETFLSSRGLSTTSIAETLGTPQTGNFLKLFCALLYLDSVG